MPNTALQTWLDRDDTELIDALKAEIREHVTTLCAHGEPFYGYAILPGKPYAVGNLVAVFNRESDLPSEDTCDGIPLTYYRYCVDEWANYEYEKFPNSNRQIADRNAQFKNLHVKEDPDDCHMDNFEIAHNNKLLNTLLTAMKNLREEGLFDGNNSFTVIWISDSGHDIMNQSAQGLNTSMVYKAYMAEFSA